MECIKEFAALAGQHIPQGGALSPAECFSYSQYLLRPFQHLQISTQLS